MCVVCIVSVRVVGWEKEGMEMKKWGRVVVEEVEEVVVVVRWDGM